MTIEDVKNYLKDNPKYYSDKNKEPIENIVSNQRYCFISDCGHEFYAFPKNAIKDWKIGCPVCAGRMVIKGVNDFNTLHPELKKYLKDIDEGYTHTEKSNKKTNWKCPYCGYEWTQTFSKMVSKTNKCVNCGKNNSFPERVMACFLNELFEVYEMEVKFDWSDNKRYDFYLPEYNMIIEMHGKQHYHENFPYQNARSLEEEKMNDEYKKELALNNGILEYVVIDASKTNFEFIKTNICESILPTLLMFSPKDIDWNECEKHATSNLAYIICQDYENGLNQKDLIKKYGKSKNTIKEYLKQGAKFGWCSYNPDEMKKLNNIRSSEWVVRNMSKPVLQLDTNTGEMINEFPSIQEAQRQLKVSHIWDCIVGKRKTAGEYKWKYK